MIALCITKRVKYFKTSNSLQSLSLNSNPQRAETFFIFSSEMVVNGIMFHLTSLLSHFSCHPAPVFSDGHKILLESTGHWSRFGGIFSVPGLGWSERRYSGLSSSTATAQLLGPGHMSWAQELISWSPTGCIIHNMCYHQGAHHSITLLHNMC